MIQTLILSKSFTTIKLLYTKSLLHTRINNHLFCGLWRIDLIVFDPYALNVRASNYYLSTGCKGRTVKYCKPEILKYGPSLRDPCIKNEGLVFHSTAQAIRLINSLLMAKTKMHRTFTENFPTIFRKIIFHEISPKSFPKVFC